MKTSSDYGPPGKPISCVPLYGMFDPNTDAVDFMGSGTLVRFRGRPLLITAAHVIENGRKFHLMIGGPNPPVRIVRPALLTPVQPGLKRDTDPMDFCVIQLSSAEADAMQTCFRFIEWEQEALLNIPEKAFPHKTTGYPETANDVNVESKTLAVNCLQVDMMEDRNTVCHAPWPDVKAHPFWYIGLRYDPRLLEKRDLHPKVSSLHGCSGGEIWRTDGTRTLEFAGILIQCLSNKPRRTGERIFYGFRANAINDILQVWLDKG